MDSLSFCTNSGVPAIDNGQSFHSWCASQINRAPSGAVINIQPAGSTSVGETEMWSLNLPLSQPMTMPHSSWIFHRVMCAVKGDNRTWVGLLLEDGFGELAQFALVMRERVCLLAVGPRGGEVLHAAAEAEATYDPANFDLDGYPIAELAHRRERVD